MIRETLQKAEQGDALYQSLAGSLYESGQGLPQDYAQAVALRLAGISPDEFYRDSAHVEASGYDARHIGRLASSRQSA
jgi:hypothetical protein